MSEKINVQNLGGRGRGAPIHPLIGAVRNLLIAPDGYKLVIADSAQIEARLLAWLAGQDDLFKGFANGEDIYSVFAATLFGEKVWKPTDEEKKTPGGATANIRRGFGKDAILGCGYGMGTLKFFTDCRANDSLRPLFDSGEYDWNFIDRLIKTYRKTYDRIPGLWRSIEKAFRFVCRYPGQTKEHYIPGPTMLYQGNEIETNASFDPQLLFWKTGSTVNIQLPSGRVLYYHHAKVSVKGDLSYGLGRHHVSTWGGALVENIIQAIARDLLGYWILECEDIGQPIILTCHDEIVSYDLTSGAEDALQNMICVMRRSPAWAEGIPLDAEGSVSQCYIK